MEDHPMSLGKRLREERKRRHLTQDEVAAVLETTKQAIYKYERGIVENIPFDKLNKLAELFECSPSYLMGWTDDSQPLPPGEPLPTAVTKSMRPVSLRHLPMLGNVACGEPVYAEEEHEHYAVTTDHINADFCLRATGDSMVNARIFDGDILFIHRCDIVEDGEIAVVLIEDEATVKRVYYDRENSVLTLVPENPTFRTMRFCNEELEHIRILGKVVAVQYNVR
jgi:repressor LexA